MTTDWSQELYELEALYHKLVYIAIANVSVSNKEDMLR